MKLNLLLGSNDIRTGFVNIDPTAADNDPVKFKGDVFNLDHIADGNEVQELLAYEVLDYVPADKADKVLAHWFSKIAHKGTITVSCTDLNEVARCLQHRIMHSDEANAILYGQQKQPWQFKKCAFTLAILAQTFTEHGFKVLASRIHNYRGIVTGQRP